LRMLIIL